MKLTATIAAAAVVALGALGLPGATAATPLGGPYVTGITGTEKAGFVKTYNTGETVTYVPIGQAQKACANGPASQFDRCMGIIDARYPDLSELKLALEKAQH